MDDLKKKRARDRKRLEELRQQKSVSARDLLPVLQAMEQRIFELEDRREREDEERADLCAV